MKTPLLRTGLISFAMLALAACGGSDDASQDEYDAEYFMPDETFDESQLPADFPRDLVPPDYHAGGFVELGQVTGASFESTAAVEDSIDHYTKLLGEPLMDIQSGDGDRMVQWRDTPYEPWIVAVIGNDGESIISISKPPAE